MADLNITPSTIDLAAAGTAIFKATDSAGKDLAVTWTVNPAVGKIDPLTGGPSASMTYTAPQQINNAQTVTVTAANSGGVSASATISLTPAPAVGSTPAPPAMPVGTVSAAPRVSITPPSIRLTGGQVVTFQAWDNAGKALEVTWKISPAWGIVDSITGGRSTSLTYTALPQVLSPQAVTVTATPATGDAATASIFLTPNPVEITPATVELKQTQQQRFNVAVAGDPANKVTWNISPNIGTIQDGTYTAPDKVDDSATVTVIATTDLWKQTATVTLTPPPWTGRRRNALGYYLLTIFCLVFLLIGLWPPSLPDSATAKADRLEAVKNAEDKANTLTKAMDAKNALDTAATAAAKTEAQAALSKAQKESDEADKDLEAKQKIEKSVTSLTVDAPFGSISRDIDLVLLVLLAGALGSFLHSARSFADFVGNKRLAGSWAWWYILHPFMGAILALVFYAAIRGGFLVLTGGTNMKASDLSTYGVTAIAAFVGMFSNQATQKLADIFDVLFKPSSGKELKNPLDGTTPANSSGGTASASSSGSPTAATQAGSVPAGPQTKA